MKVPGMLEQPGPEKEFPLFFEVQPVVIFQVSGNYRMIESLSGDEFFKLMPGV